MKLDDLAGRAVISVAEAGELLGLKRSAAYSCAGRGELPTLKLGRKLLVPVPSLLRLLGAAPEAERMDGAPGDLR